MQDNWHTEQDKRVDEVLDALSVTLDRASTAWRVWYHVANMVFYNAHLLNVILIKKKTENFRILDIGCGDGIIARDIASFFENAEVVGMDANAKSLEIARSKPNPQNLSFLELNFMQADLTEMEKLGKFDVVICSEVFEHVEDTDRLFDLIEYRLKEGGYLSFSTPSGWMYRLPRAAFVRWALSDTRTWYRLGVNPEKNWREALKIHPGIQPSKLMKRMKVRGFEVVNRIASCFYLSEDRKNSVHAGVRLVERISPVKGPTVFFYLYLLCEALMNIFPVFRIFESRVILLLRYRGQ